MTVGFLLGLLVLAMSPLLLRARLGKSWTSRPYGFFVLAALLYHGLSETALRLTDSIGRVPRPDVQYVDAAMLLAGGGLLAMTIGYLLMHPPGESATLDRDELARVIDWRLMALCLAPLLAATVSGQGYLTGQALNGAGVTTGGLAAQFFVPVLVLTSFGFLLRHPTRLIPTLAVQSVVMALAGQRLEVLITAILLVVMAGRIGIHATKRQLAAGTVIGLLLLVGVTSSRAQAGRDLYYGDTGATARVTAIVEGMLSPDLSGVHGAGPLVDASLRLESNSYGGWISAALDNGAQPLGATPLWTSAAGMVPSVFFPEKLSALSVQERSPAQWTQDVMGIPPVNLIPGHLLFYYGALGGVWLLVFLFAFGLVVGLADLWAIRSTTAWGVLGLLTLTETALDFEHGTIQYLVNARAFVAAGIVLAVIAALRRRRAERRHRASQCQPLRPIGHVASRRPLRERH